MKETEQFTIPPLPWYTITFPDDEVWAVSLDEMDFVLLYSQIEWAELYADGVKDRQQTKIKKLETPAQALAYLREARKGVEFSGWNSKANQYLNRLVAIDDLIRHLEE